MFGRKSKLTTLEVRKELLIAESEVNRAGMREDWALLQEVTQQCVAKGKSALSMASTAAIVAAGVSALRGIWSPGKSGESTWLARLLKVARVGASLWFTARTRSQ